MRIFNNVELRDVIYLKFEEKSFTSLTMLELESEDSISFIIKEFLILYCRKFLTFIVTVII